MDGTGRDPKSGGPSPAHSGAAASLGGASTVFGATVGAIFFGIARPLAESTANRLDLLEALTASQQSLLVLAILVIGFMLVEPAGLRGVWMNVKRYFASWPFRY